RRRAGAADRADAPLGDAALVVLGRHVDGHVPARISDQTQWVVAVLHRLHVLLEQLAVQDNAHVGRAQLLFGAIGDRPLRVPHGHVLAQVVVQRVPGWTATVIDARHRY